MQEFTKSTAPYNEVFDLKKIYVIWIPEEQEIQLLMRICKDTSVLPAGTIEKFYWLPITDPDMATPISERWNSYPSLHEAVADRIDDASDGKFHVLAFVDRREYRIWLKEHL